jgi:hypothetical protein
VLRRLDEGPGDDTSDIGMEEFGGDDALGEVAVCVMVCVVGFIRDIELEFIDE